MQAAVKAGARPRCAFRVGDRVVSFVVISCPDYGVLELANFSSNPVL